LSEDLLFCDRVQRAGIKIHAHTGAVMPHHKSMWVTEAHYDDWLKKQDIR
jgi:GT2 family glycosyltransferase